MNNAGIAVFDSINAVNKSEFDRIFDKNVRSVVTLTELLIMRSVFGENGGQRGEHFKCIWFKSITSVAGLRSMERLMSYCMSKAVLDQFIKCSALDLEPKGIRVNSVNPSVIQTPIIAKVKTVKDELDQFIGKIKSKYPVGY